MCERCAGGLTFFGLAEPQSAMLASYAAALRSGWSPNNLRDVSGEQLRQIAADPAGFVAGLTDQTGHTRHPDGMTLPRLPFRLRWMWDDQFCCTISLRYQPGTDALPPHAAGHIGFAVVPWKRNHGYATRALRQMLGEARDVGLTRLEIATDVDNIASRTVIERNGGVRAGTWPRTVCHATGALDRFTISLTTTA